MKIAIVGGGLSGLVCAYQCNQLNLDWTLFEASNRLGGIIDTERREGFVLEGGPDGWVREKPWLRELAEELGLADEIIPSNDAQRVTYIYRDGALHAVPDGMRMMVATDMEALRHSSLFDDAAIAAYEAETTRAEALRQYALEHAEDDESVSRFVSRHFGDEVTQRLAAPLLAGVFGGDVDQLSVRSVMPQFVIMEREHGSLVLALRQRASAQRREASIFQSMQRGIGSILDELIATLPPQRIRRNTPANHLAVQQNGVTLQMQHGEEQFDHVVLATPAHVTRRLLAATDQEASLLLQMDASSAVLIYLGYTAQQAQNITIPRGFGVLVPPRTQGTDLLAATFFDQKFNHRVPDGGIALRAFMGSEMAEKFAGESDEFLVALARRQLESLLNVTLPEAAVTLVRSWPRSLPQYAVGHADRMRRLGERVALYPQLTLIGNAYHGVGMPDLVRDARAAAHRIAQL